MRKSSFCNLFTLAILMLGLAGFASAQATRTWVSGVGDDANPCSRTAPCKTFAGAISKTATGGEINCLDPGGFGALTITKSIKIDCGFTGGILAATVNGIIVNAGATSDVIIRNLEIHGALSGGSVGINGIRYLAGRSVHLENMHISGFSTNCVDVQTGASAGQITLHHVFLESCGTNGLNLATTANVQINAQVSDVQITGATTGINAGNGTRLAVDRTMIVNIGTGILQSAAAGGGSNVFVTSCMFDKAGTALQSAAGSVMGATLSSFSNVSTIFNINGGSLFTAGDNSHFNEAIVGATSGGIGKV